MKNIFKLLAIILLAISFHTASAVTSCQPESGTENGTCRSSCGGLEKESYSDDCNTGYCCLPIKAESCQGEETNRNGYCKSPCNTGETSDNDDECTLGQCCVPKNPAAKSASTGDSKTQNATGAPNTGIQAGCKVFKSDDKPKRADVWLTAPLDECNLYCYLGQGKGKGEDVFKKIIGKDKNGDQIFVGEKGNAKCDIKTGIIVQRLESAKNLNTGPGATSGATMLIDNYIGQIFSILVKLGLLIAIGAIVVGGIAVSMSNGEDSVSAGKEKIVGGIVALLLLILSGVVLNTINPLYFTWF